MADIEIVKDLPKPSVGAPMPRIVADESKLILCYYVQGGSSLDKSCLVTFHMAQFKMGMPDNDDEWRHPLYKKGLEPYEISVYNNSDWADSLGVSDSYRHYIITFHDSTFECLASSYEQIEYLGSIHDNSLKMLELLYKEAF